MNEKISDPDGCSVEQRGWCDGAWGGGCSKQEEKVTFKLSSQRSQPRGEGEVGRGVALQERQQPVQRPGARLGDRGTGSWPVWRECVVMGRCRELEQSVLGLEAP